MTQERQEQQLKDEWKAITAGCGYSGPWYKWILGFEAVPAIPQDLPDEELLQTCVQLTRHDCTAACNQEAKDRNDAFKEKLRKDFRVNHGRCIFTIIKGDRPKPLNELPTKVSTQATLRRSRKGHTTADVNPPVRLNVGQVARLGEATVRIVHQQGSRVHFRCEEETIPAQATLTQEQIAVEPAEIFEVVDKFWGAIWNRDEHKDQFSGTRWESFETEIRDIPFPETLTFTPKIDDYDLWCKTVRNLKNNKAAGTDGWRAEELKALPDEALRDLRDVLQPVISEGFTSQHMQARTVLLQKRNPPISANDSRPITILGILNRALAKMISDQFLQHWAHTMPPTISGGLPGRSARQLSYREQIILEQAHTNNEPVIGFTLDLIKAFNLIPRRVIVIILKRLRVPTKVIQWWIKSLSRIERIPQVGQVVGPTIKATTGVPEGDGLSVMVMGALSLCFYYKIQSPRLLPFTYADNWTYMAKEEKAYYEAFQHTLNLVTAMEMKIDYNKSWTFATHKQHKHVHEALALRLPSTQTRIPVKTNAKELGTNVVYGAKQQPGCIKDRFAAATRALQKLTPLPLALADKGRAIQQAVWPIALFGTEAYPVSTAHFDKIRREATTALVGPYKYANGYLSMMCLSPYLQDPFLEYCLGTIRCIRHLATVDIDIARDVAEDINNASQRAKTGPAAALRHVLKKLSVKYDQDGHCEAPEEITLDILRESTKELKRKLQEVWMYHVKDQLSNRKGAPQETPDLRLFQKVYRQFDAKEQHNLGTYAVGGYQPNPVKALHNEHIQPECELCQQIDGRRHRLLECPETREIRREHPEAINALEANPSWIYLPIPTQHPDVPVMRHVAQQRRLPEVEPVQGEHVFFTDGSCDLTTNRYARRASWAVIHCSQRPEQVQENLPEITCVAVSMTQGDQNISRAELQAVKHALKIAHASDPAKPVDIHTDSEYAKRAVKRVEDQEYQLKSHEYANGDILREIQQLWQPQLHKIHKVKAHRQKHTATNLADLTRIMGNEAADQAAKIALARDEPEAIEITQEIDRHMKTQTKQMHQVLRYIGQLNAQLNEKKAQKEQATTEKERKTVALGAVGAEAHKLLRNAQTRDPEQKTVYRTHRSRIHSDSARRRTGKDSVEMVADLRLG